MKLDAYLSSKKLSNAEFARLIGVATETVRRYCLGERVPQPRIMAAIVFETNGRVKPNDFFALPKKIGVSDAGGAK